MKFTATDYKKLRRRERLKKEVQYKSYLKFRADYCNYYPSMVLPRDKNRNNLWITKSFLQWDDEEKNVAYYKRCYRGNHNGNQYQFYKKYANKIVRRYKGEISKGGSYKKCFDYRWTVV